MFSLDMLSGAPSRMPVRPTYGGPGFGDPIRPLFPGGGMMPPTGNPTNPGFTGGPYAIPDPIGGRPTTMPGPGFGGGFGGGGFPTGPTGIPMPWLGLGGGQGPPQRGGFVPLRSLGHFGGMTAY